MASYYATCPFGAEQLLADELKALSIDVIKPTRGGVAFETDDATAIYRVAMYSSLHQRLLLILGRFAASTPEALYAGVQSIDWADHLAPEGSLRVDAKLRDCDLGQPHFAALKVKDAIVDQFREAFDTRPSVSIRNPDLRIDLFVHKTHAQLAIDLGGMAKVPTPRGAMGDAMEAALLLGFMPTEPSPCVIVGGANADLVVAAAARQACWAPGLLRDHFGFERWQGHIPARWNQLCEQAKARVQARPEQRLVVFDQDMRTIKRTQEHLQAYGLAKAVIWPRKTLAQMRPESEPGWVINQLPLQAATHAEALDKVLNRYFQGWHLLDRSEGRPSYRWSWPPQETIKFTRGKRELQLRRFAIKAQERSQPKADSNPAESAALADLPVPDELSNRLKKNLKHLGRWARKHDVHGYRLYDADLPNFAAAVDVYECEQNWAVVQEYEAPAQIPEAAASERLNQLVAAIQTQLELPPERVIVKRRQRQRGKAQYEKLSRQGQFHVLLEAGLKLQVNFTDYLDTGIFLDHRDVRAWLGRHAKDQHVLNLFAYTGVATLHMVAGGARSSTTVDMSRTYLDWAQRNLALNAPDKPVHKFIQADCLAWLQQQSEQATSKRYGLIFMDPPTFSSSKRMEGTLDVQRDHVRLIQQACALLRPGGTLVFSNNYRKFAMDREALADYEIEDMTSATLPEDFRRNPKIHVVYRIQPRH